MMVFILFRKLATILVIILDFVLLGRWAHHLHHSVDFAVVLWRALEPLDSFHARVRLLRRRAKAAVCPATIFLLVLLFLMMRRSVVVDRHLMLLHVIIVTSTKAPAAVDISHLNCGHRLCLMGWHIGWVACGEACCTPRMLLICGDDAVAHSLSLCLHTYLTHFS